MPDLFHRPRRLQKDRKLARAGTRNISCTRGFRAATVCLRREKVRREIPSMPGVHNLSVDEIAKEAAAAAELGVKGVILFGLPETKDEFRLGRLSRQRNCAAGGACHSRGCSRPGDHDRHLSLRVHLARTLRRGARRRSLKRSIA